MIEFFVENQHAAWFTLGFFLLALEMLLGFATGFVLFVGLAALLTGALIWFQLIPNTWFASVASFGISAGAISAVLYHPLKRLQNASNVVEKDTSSDMIGLEFRLEQDLSLVKTGLKKYSGIAWRVEIAQEARVDEIPAGSLVTVVTVDVALFRVKPVTIG